MVPRIKTGERIVRNSLDLFNRQGERSAGTDHIAAPMAISPGNLYDPFPKEQAIIAMLFAEYEAQVDSFLRPLHGRATLDKRRHEF
ncbi:transcriptional regulator, TetR family [Pseudomonas agarici]|nr:transcriptional regulator, TetR family [Pseudomonas agarici]